MKYLDKRIQVICDQLKKLSIKQREPIHEWAYKKGKFLYPADAHENQSAFASFDSSTMRWYGPDEYYWFSASLTVPEHFEGRPLWLNIRTQIEEWDDGKNPQFLLFANGEPVQGVDMNHRDVLLCPQAKAGDVYRLDMQAYTGTLHAEFNLIVDMIEVEPEILGLYYDLWVPLSGFARMERESRSYMDLERVLNEAVNLLDLRLPYSPAFTASVEAARDYLGQHLYTDLAGHDEVIATCIGHTHIDVAWWWTVSQTREKVARSFSTVLKLMDEYPNYRFMSSQAQLYVFLKERYPELYQKVKDRIAEGRWEPEGGMWVEADCNLTSGESLVRQFVYGKQFFKEEFGVDNRILWLPDVFGYSGALPQIMRECGIDYFMTTKLSWNQFNQFPHDTFMWRGIDGTEILTHLISTLGVGQDVKNFFTTYNGILHPDAIIGGWQRYQNKDINNDILISYGYGDGGGGPTRDMLETSKRMETGITGLPKVRQAFARTYFDELSQRVQSNKRLPMWEGELYFEYHRGTLTSMARNKRSNRKAEIAMMDLELLSVLSQGLLPYPLEQLNTMWKTILLNQFHDILPGTSIHEVYEVTKAEYEAVHSQSSTLIKERMEAICPPSEQIAVFNTKGFDSSEYVLLPGEQLSALSGPDGRIFPAQITQEGSLVYLSELPSKGYTVFTAAQSEPAPIPFSLKGNLELDTPYYSVKLDENGLFLSLFDKDYDREIIKAGEKGNLFRMYEDKPIYYDNWDIDIYHTEKYWDATDIQSMEWTEMGPLRATLQIERKISQSLIRQTIRFYADSRRIDFQTYVDWHENQHLLKVHFPLDIHTDEATFDIQFGNLKRKTHQNTSWDVARFESCGQKWADLSEGHYGVSLLNDCKYGHSVKDGNMALTLIKSGIEPNPVTDQEEHFFTYALWPHAGDWRIGETVQEAYRLNQPALVSKGGMPTDSFSLAYTSHSNVMLETVKRAEDGRGYIVRLYETDNARTNASLYWNGDIASVEECNAIEEKKGDAAFDCKDIPFTIKPYEIKTFRIQTK